MTPVPQAGAASAVRAHGVARPASVRAKRYLLAATAVTIGVGLAVGGAGAGPRRPTDGREAIARVPARASDPAVRDLAELERRLDARPHDAALAARVARLAIDAARRRSDPRFWGKAEAVLAPWWAEAAPPDDILLLRATVRQARHDFARALADVDALLARRPGDAQAHL